MVARHLHDQLPKKTITSALEVTETMLDEFWEEVEGRYLDTKINWEDVFDRMERYTDWDFGGEWDTPAIKKIKREMKLRKREAS